MSATVAKNVDRILDIFARADDPVLSSTEIAEEMEITQQWAHKLLQEAHESGYLHKKKMGARSVAWWPVDRESGRRDR